MTSKKVIDRLQISNWFIECKTDHEIALVLNACFDAKLKWLGGSSAAEYAPDSPIKIGMGGQILIHDQRLWAGSINGTSKDITDWFFEELRNE